MSKFFRVTLEKDVVIDDSVTNDFTGWSGDKILHEIERHRVTRFDQLDDVNVINKQDKQPVVYSADTGKFITVDWQAMADGAGLSLKQLVRMGVNGSVSSPVTIDVPISTLDFKVPKVNVLRFQLGTQNILKTQNSFSNGESNTFELDDMILFDGAVHLKNNFPIPLNYESDIDGYKEYSANLDESVYKSISSIAVNTSNTDYTLDINATPLDRLLIPTGDIDLSSASHIDYFNITATGNLKIVCSVDSGLSWKTFKNNQWEDIASLSVNDVNANGLTIADFKAISEVYWNLLITSNKIRFAYLLCDTVSIDELKIQYDGQGYWVEAKDSDYDVIYASNSLLQVKLYFAADVKINY